jgi:AraC family transcriptional activator of pobA
MGDLFHIHSLSQLHKMMHCPAPKHPLVSVIDYEESKPDKRFEKRTIQTDFYFISMKDPAPKSLLYGRAYYDFEEGSLLFMAPGQVFSVGTIEESTTYKGWTLFFHPDLLSGTHLGRAIRNYSFFSYSVHEALHVSEEEKVMLTTIVDQIRSEYNRSIDNFSQTVMVTAIEQLLNYSSRFYARQFITRHKQNREIVSRFDELVKAYFQSDKPLQQGIPGVEHFATQLHYSASYLSDLLKKETGMTMKDYIQQEILEQAKMKLLHTRSSVNEIAYELGFEYPQYFNRLFKTKVGMTPLEFRNSYN